MMLRQKLPESVKEEIDHRCLKHLDLKRTNTAYENKTATQRKIDEEKVARRRAIEERDTRDQDDIDLGF